MAWEPSNILLVSLLFIAVSAMLALIVFRQMYSSTGLPVAGMGASFSVGTIKMLAKKNVDMKDYFKAFYDMKYENLVFVIKGISSTILLFVTPFIEKIIKQEKAFSNTDLQLLVVVALLLVLLLVLTFRLRKIVQEYGETIRLYHTYK
jgi:hypothetical protein